VNGNPVHLVDLGGKELDAAHRVDQVMDLVDVGAEGIAQPQAQRGSEHRDEQAVEEEDLRDSPRGRSQRHEDANVFRLLDDGQGEHEQDHRAGEDDQDQHDEIDQQLLDADGLEKVGADFRPGLDRQQRARAGYGQSDLVPGLCQGIEVLDLVFIQGDTESLVAVGAGVLVEISVEQVADLLDIGEEGAVVELEVPGVDRAGDEEALGDLTAGVGAQGDDRQDLS